MVARLLTPIPSTIPNFVLRADSILMDSPGIPPLVYQFLNTPSVEIKVPHLIHLHKPF